MPALSVGQTLPTHAIKAHNYAPDSDNRIHGPEAEALGFRSGLVPGIGLHAYMIRPIVEALGPEWVARGSMSIRFVKPVYDGDILVVESTVIGAVPPRVSLRLEDHAGETRAAGEAGIPDRGPRLDPFDFPEAPLPAPNRRRPPLISQLPPGLVLGTRHLKLDLELAARTFLEDIREPSPLFRGPEAVLHPSLLLAQANYLFRDNIELGPWIHTGSEVRHYGPARHGEELAFRARVVRSFEKRGHQVVEAEIAVFGPGHRPVARIAHEAIVRLRPPGVKP